MCEDPFLVVLVLAAKDPTTSPMLVRSVLLVFWGPSPTAYPIP